MGEVGGGSGDLLTTWNWLGGGVRIQMGHAYVTRVYGKVCGGCWQDRRVGSSTGGSLVGWVRNGRLFENIWLMKLRVETFPAGLRHVRERSRNNIVLDS